jgi:small-conductance mechanosensitive channel
LNEAVSSLQGYFTPEMLVRYLQAGVQLVLGFFVAWLGSFLAGRLLRLRLEPVRVRLLRRIAFYSIFVAFIAAALATIGLPIGGVVLGTGGVLAIAIGFASQTSFSNVVSGLFLIAERPFDVGDIITTGGTTGEVLSIDLLSVKLRTFDNLFVRIPNENLLKSEVRTLTRFPIRRVDLALGVSYAEDLAQVQEVLKEVADRNPLCLEEPAPQIFLTGFGSSSIDFQLSVWATRENFIALKNGIQEQIKRAFDEHGIEIPFPHMTVTSGKAARPLQVESRGEK